MTAAERAKRLCDQAGTMEADHIALAMGDTEWDWLEQAISTAINEAVNAERGACAVIAETLSGQRLHLHEASQQSDLLQLADEIRKRGQP